MNIHMRALSRLFGFFRTSGRRSGVAIASAVLLVPLLTAPVSLAADACQPGANAIVCENSKPGNPWQDWDIDGAGDTSIQGFSTDISVNVGGTIDFKIDTDAAAYTIDIYRTGWYQGLGARKIGSVQPSAPLPQHQPECKTDIATELTDCGTWSVSASWTVPQTAVSGVYLAKLTRRDTGGSSHITFIVRNDASHSDVLFQTSDPTWHAYNKYGGADFYQGAANGRAYKISYNRPFATRGGVEARDFYFGAEYPLVRFLERNGYDVSYFSGVDTDRRGDELLNHNVVLSVGHDEYWSAGQRANLEAARDAGVNLQFLSGNEGYWRTRYEPSTTDGGKYRTLVSYKETWSNAKIDPSSEWTGTWRDPRFSPQVNGGGLPENALTGTAYKVNDGLLPVTVSSAEGKLRLWRGTSLTTLANGTTVELAPNTIGYESNEDLDNGFRPAGLIRLSTTHGDIPQYLQDFGNTVLPGQTTHHLTMYKAKSGALVFSAGSIQWTWGLDDWHPGEDQPADPRMQQAQVNLLADMGAEPQTLMSGLVTATPSTDTTPPSIAVTSAPGSVANGAQVTIKGTASDAGGVVAGVEYSLDSGKTWHPGVGTASWSISYVQHGIGNNEVFVRAIDDSGNYPQTAAAIPMNVTGPYSVFGQTKPQRVDAGDSESVELGLRIHTMTDGYVTGVRFYKSSSNAGTHTGSLWSLDGKRLARATFSNESASGWQEVLFSEPVMVQAGSDYVVSYSAPTGGYSSDDNFFAYRGMADSPLSVAGGFGVDNASVYNTDGGFPASSFRQSNYYVDAVFASLDSVPLSAVGHEPADTAVSVPLNAAISALMSKPVVADSVSISLADGSGAVPGSTTYDPTTRKASFVPSAALAPGTVYTAKVDALDPAGNPVQRGESWSFRTVLADRPAGDCPCGLFADSLLPDVGLIDENTPLTLGTRFAADTSGKILGMEYYRAEGNLGPHVGRIYRMDGSKLAEVPFPENSVSGWQYAEFSTPVSVQADTEYIAAYTTQGTYSLAMGALEQPTSVGPLRTGVRSGQFVYADGFPGQSISTNYLVDVSFQPDEPPMALVQASPTQGSADAPTDTVIRATFNHPVAPGYAFAVQGPSGALAGTVTTSTDGKTLSFAADGGLPAAENVVVTLKNVSSTDGSVLPEASWIFSTAASGQPTTVLGNLAPAQLDPHDTDAVELGVRLTTSQTIDVKAIRFYKGPAGSGSHTGSLWDSAGNRLAQVTFSGSTGTGWQIGKLSTPIRLQAGETFTVSYYAPEGGYVYTASGFAGFVPTGPLSLAGANGVFVYGSGGGLPNQSWNNANYFADLVYEVVP